MDSQQLLQDLQWRYATKKFSEKKISDSDLETLLEALRLAPSSFGIQPWRFVVVTDIHKRKELLPHSRNQSQVVDASHLIVLCHYAEMSADHVQAYAQDMIQKTWATRESLQWYIDMMLWFVDSKSSQELDVWMKKQVYIALWFLLQTAAHMHIDACPMEGFDPTACDDILGLGELGLSSCLLCPVWYRADDDPYASRPKIRFAPETIVIKQ